MQANVPHLSVKERVQRFESYRVNKEPVFPDSFCIKKELCPRKSLIEKVASKGGNPFKYRKPCTGF